MAPLILKRKPAAATNHGELKLVFSTTHSAEKDRTRGSYHNDDIRV